MKKILVLFLILFLISCKSTQKLNTYYFNSIKNKEYVGKFVSSEIIKLKFPKDKFTLIQTDSLSIPVDGVLNINVGDSCYIYVFKTDKYKDQYAFIWKNVDKIYYLK